MRTALVAVAIIVLALGWTSEAVHVEENGLTFSLEAVKRLQELSAGAGAMGAQSPRLRASTMSQCSDPMLPQEFVSLCKQRSASASFARLVAVPLDLCEICAFAACAGC
ncbi:guanylate cyclase activator 2B-like [Nelusetta ayraudi]|uniref:guanylate cyclase activator 2B-like n=1 Tax=Nelusetta ayraudi TaxID=303726 RepID=UPI003F7032E6